MMSRLFTLLCVATVLMLPCAASSVSADTQVATITIKEKVVKAKDCATQADEKKLKGTERETFLDQCEKAATEHKS